MYMAVLRDLNYSFTSAASAQPKYVAPVERPAGGAPVQGKLSRPRRFPV